MSSFGVYEMELMVSEVAYSVFSPIWEISISSCMEMACCCFCWCVCVCPFLYTPTHLCVSAYFRCVFIFVSEHICAHCVRVCVKINQSGGDDEQFL